MSSSLRPLEGLSPARARAIGLLATDVDGTLTRQGRLAAELLAALDELARAGIEVMPISGRPAGEVLGLVRYLPGVRRGIAENGLVAVEANRRLRFLRAPPRREQLYEVAEWLRREHGARLEETPDTFCRIGDLAFERGGQEAGELERLCALAATRDVHLIWSNVHIHISIDEPDKGAGLLAWLPELGYAPAQVATIGDARNDVGLFMAGRFGVTVGTADVRASLLGSPHAPEFVTEERELPGFLALARTLLRARADEKSV